MKPVAFLVEKVESIGIPGKVKYLPHQAVIGDDHSSKKLRAVFDESSKTIGPSLNGTFPNRPCQTPLLFHVILRLQFNPIGIIADIEKVYLQISVADCHRHFIRFLWFDDIFKDISEVTKYRFCRVIFGVNCSQYLLHSAIRFRLTYADGNLEISGKLKDKFGFIVKFVKTLTAVNVSKYFFYDIMPRDYIVSYELRGISDASKKAYGLVSI